jgi:hypothetical protein
MVASPLVDRSDECQALRQVLVARRSAAAAADVDVAWMETTLDAEFSLIRQRQADAGLGWLTASSDELPAPMDAMSLGEFEPDVWIPPRTRRPDAG